MEILRLASILILILGSAFLIAELITEEVEFFAPVAIISIIIGLILFFLSDPKEWFNLSDAIFPYFTAIIWIIGSIPIIFSLIILIKIRSVKNKPSEMFDFIGNEVKVVKPINPTKKGYVLFRGEKWLANSSDSLKEGEKAIIEEVNLDGLTLNVKRLSSEVKPTETTNGIREMNKSIKMRKCPDCSNEIKRNTKICPYCGYDLEH